MSRLFIETLLIDEELADQARAAWDTGEIDAVTAWWAWLIRINN